MLLLNAIFAIRKTVLFLSDSIGNNYAIVKCYFAISKRVLHIFLAYSSNSIEIVCYLFLVLVCYLNQDSVLFLL